MYVFVCLYPCRVCFWGIRFLFVYSCMFAVRGGVLGGCLCVTLFIQMSLAGYQVG